MDTSRLFEPLTLRRGPAMRNRFMLAPLTNRQSRPDGVMSEEEYRWLTMRAKGGFGLVLTAASHVQARGQGFAGQIGVFGDQHIEGLTRLASGLRAAGAVSGLQLHHAGDRAEKALVEEVVAPSEHSASGARGLTGAEVEALRDDFIAGAKRAEAAGFDGVEIHGAHGYILAEFLSADINRRTDAYGGSLENRSRLLFEIISGVRAACGPEFQIGLRLSGERFGLKLAEIVSVTTEVFRRGEIDYFELSAWDVAKEPAEEAFQGRTLLSHFTELARGEIRLGAAGKILGGHTAAGLLEAGCDFAVIGRAAILRHDFPECIRRDPAYASAQPPVSAAFLAAEGVSPAFVDYLRTFPAFVAEDAQGAGHFEIFDTALKAGVIT